jgi:chromosome segregation protein
MRELNQQMQQARQQLGRQLAGPGRQEPEFDLERIRDRFKRNFRDSILRTRSEEQIRHMEELGEKARQIELELEELGDRNPERTERLHAELREIHGAIEQIEHDVNMSREQGDMPQMHLRELKEHAQELEHRLQELGDSHPEEAQELRMHLDQIHQQIDTIEREPYLLTPLFPIEEQMLHGDELHREELMVRREQLQAQLRETELMLGELNEQGKAESEEAQMCRQQLRVFTDQLKATENELREGQPGRAREPGREDLEREVQDLRKQMDNVNQQMGEMRELMKRLLEKGESREAG